MNILVPVDFSKYSDRALRVAAILARRMNGDIIALHMLEISPSLLGTSDYLPQEQTLFLMKMAEKQFASFLDKPYLQGLKVTPMIKHFKVFSEVNDVAKENGSELIVMGSHGSEGLEEVFFGSNAEKVIRNADVPVLVVKKEHEDFEVERFVFASDFNEESVPAARKAAEFASKINAEFKMVYVNTPGDAFLSTEDAFERITAFLNIARLGTEVEVYNDYNVEKGIIAYSESVAAGLIGIPTHGRKGMAHILLGSIGEDLANHAHIPVITFKI